MRIQYIIKLLLIDNNLNIGQRARINQDSSNNPDSKKNN